MPDIYTCGIVEKTRLTDVVFAVTVVCGKLAEEARAGQFVHIECGCGSLLRRPVSICRVDGDKLKFVFEVKGEGTRWLSGQEPGQTLSILGPLGSGFRFSEGGVITVGGGIGVPPMLFASESAKSGGGRVTAILGFRDVGRVILKEEFEAVCDEVLINTDDGSFGIPGSVTAPLADLLDGGEYGTVMACGPRAMLRAVAEVCRLHGVDCQVSLEERMGCGVGACLVCACATVKDGREQMSRVCKDGPVFNAGEVVW